MKTAEEIFNEIFEIPTGNLPCGERFIKFKNEIISAMEAYASQSQPTDKQIEKWAESIYSKTYGAKYIKLLVEGAKALREGKIPTKD